VIHRPERLSRTGGLRQSPTWRLTAAASPPRHPSLC
jgi:hypothetical protein